MFGKGVFSFFLIDMLCHPDNFTVFHCIPYYYSKTFPSSRPGCWEGGGRSHLPPPPPSAPLQYTSTLGIQSVFFIRSVCVCSPYYVTPTTTTWLFFFPPPTVFKIVFLPSPPASPSSSTLSFSADGFVGLACVWVGRRRSFSSLSQ